MLLHEFLTFATVRMVTQGRGLVAMALCKKNSNTSLAIAARLKICPDPPASATWRALFANFLASVCNITLASSSLRPVHLAPMSRLVL